MIDILYYAEELNVGGVENMMLQWVEHVDSNIHIDLFVREVIDETMRNRFTAVGCEVYEAKCSVKNFVKKAHELSKVFKQKKYDIIHIHTSLATDFLVLAIAKRYGVKHRITHSHNVPIIPRFITRWADKICKPLLRHYTTDFFGCSKQAAIALFGNKKKYIGKYTVIKNGIDVERFKFSMQNRNDIRKEFLIADDDYVIGSVGRLDFQKNYEYLLRIVAGLNLEQCKLKVLIIGDGYEREALQVYAKAHNINLLLPGKRNDVNKVLSCFDLFVLTSRYEGFPVVMMEAQANGLDGVVSEAIPEEAIFGENIRRIDLSNEKLWLDYIIEHINIKNNEFEKRSNRHKGVINAGYEINNCAKTMIQFYFQLKELN
ncbi:MAG: glycosyltransferase [Eubacteriales bacterium]|nr:glycosyltransferase [Eubacteriales bacterium]MDD4474333.1 glycosyltransferase [Eubacteriales bacterium]